MTGFDLGDLGSFIVRAQAVTYVGSGEESSPSRPGSHDLAYSEGPFTHLDSSVGSADFLGEELVTHDGAPVWAMNYYGRLLRPDLMSAAEAGAVLKTALSVLYWEGRFLGGFEHVVGDDVYVDTNTGDVAQFSGLEWISRGGVKVYELDYHGGLVRE